MKKIFLMGILIFSILSLSEDKKFNIVLKSSFENEGRLRKIEDFKLSKMVYKPVDLTVYTLNNSLSANLVLQGNRKLAKQPNSNTRYIYDGTDNKGDLQKEDSYYITEFITNRNSVSYSSFENHLSNVNKEKSVESEDHDHHHDHEHGHDHDHEEHDHDHKSILSGDSLNISKPRNTKTIKENSDFQAKLSLSYNKPKYGLKYTKYLTSFDEEDNRYFKNDSITEFKLIGVHKDKFSLGTISRIKGRENYPSIIETNIYGRYLYNENTFLGIDLFAGKQLSNLADGNNQRSKVRVFFDYNTEKRRYHKFWEIIDHEHDKIDQVKIEFSFDNEYKDSLSKIHKGYIDKLENKKTFITDIKLKKSNVFTKNLNISNDFQFKLEDTFKKETNRKYNITQSVHFDNWDTHGDAITYDTNGVNYHFNPGFSKVLAESYKKFKKGEELGLDEFYVPIIAENDGYILLTKFEEDFGTNSQPKYGKYYVETTAVSNGDMSYKSSRNKKHSYENKFNLSYNNSKNYFSFNEHLKYITNFNETKLESKTVGTYERKINSNLKLKNELSNEYELFKDKKSNHYQTNVLSNNININQKIVKDDVKINVGVDTKFSVLSRVAKKSRLYGSSISPYLMEVLKREFPESPYDKQLENEPNKWVHGYEFSVKPYVKTVYTPKNNLEINGSFELEKTYTKTPLTKNEGLFLPLYSKPLSIPLKYGIKFGIIYRY